MTRYSGRWALLLGLLPAAAVGAGPDPDPAAVLSRLASQRRDAARKTYLVMWLNYRESRASEETLYRWSRRWLEAERQLSERQADQVAAFEGHLERMQELESIIRKMQRSGVTTIYQVSAAEYYRVEAEMWLLQARGKKDRRR
jgi:hypothetical protein